ncbi:hypothetical protein JXA12_02325 [Candidatus Woesearchaeota archaeon]|nr:hypothetical protein [Candidatus Woesearchaeota archaeon]
MRRTSSYLLSFLLSFAAVAAGLYVPDFEVTGDVFAVNGTIKDSGDDFVYAIAPPGFKHVTVTLQGSPGYSPMLYVYDPSAEAFIFQEHGGAGDTLSFSYTNGLVKGQPQEIYAVVVDHGTPGAAYALTVTAEDQDDAGMGADAPKSFRDGFLINPGVYEGFLGGGDLIDYYALDLEQDETVYFSITPADKTVLRFILVDSTLTTRLDIQSQLDDKELKAVYSSRVKQRVFFGIEGGMPYALVIESDREVEVGAERDAAGAEEERGEADEGVVGAAEEDGSSPVTGGGEDEGRQAAGLLVMIVAIVLLIILGVAMFLSKRQSKPPKKEKSPSKHKSSGKKVKK